MVTGYWFWQVVLWLPSKTKVMEASRDLIGHSNFPVKPEGVKYDNATEIRALLNISD